MSPISADLSDIADLWRLAVHTPMHGVGCSCAGGATVRMLGDTELEDEILDYLIPRYAATGKGDLASALQNRRASRGVSFVAWLQGWNVAALPEAHIKQVLADIRTTLESLVAQH